MSTLKDLLSPRGTAAASIPTDPDRIDIGTDRPLSMLDLHMLAALRAMDADAPEYLSVLTNFVKSRTTITTDVLAGMDARIFFHLTARVMVDVLEKEHALNAGLTQLNALVRTDPHTGDQ
ncbi:MAG: hypothetical protein E6R03_16040 [Hyphomicrobiaceae bacterium]|nr:MAG: hypothetical protein E6R03_16040 [Hyphomicrobiaceae bacterium]